MPVEFDISEEDISFAESILLQQGCHFDMERRAFIKNLETIDLHAIPGSGKTTALLAKLLIIERRLPFTGGSGILVLSHTNAAIDEIKRKLLPYCPKLFSFPNYVGTIQSFVNEFLTIPFFSSVKRQRPIRIDNEIFLEMFVRKYPRNLFAGLKSKYQERLNGFLLEVEVDGSNLIHFHTDEILLIPNCAPTTPTYVQLVETKKALLREGFLNFNDTYFLAKKYLAERPKIKKYLRHRFDFVFVDEMQDMDRHQYDLLESIFYSDEAGTYQRIGDMNQSIYGAVKAENYWVPRIPELVLNFRSSQRFSQGIAKVLKPFALYHDAGFDIVGLRNSSIKPHIITYDDGTILNVIPKFFELISVLKDIPENTNFKSRLYEVRPDGTKRFPIKIISWNTSWTDDEDANNVEKVRLVDYWPSYNRGERKSNSEFASLRDYLANCDIGGNDFQPVYENIVSSFLRVLSLENVHQGNNRPYTKISLFDKLRETGEEIISQFQLNLFNWCLGIVKGQTTQTQQEIINFVPTFLAVFQARLVRSTSFLNGNAITALTTRDSPSNIFYSGGLSGEICTVHSVKGQTHCATLYLESYYHKDGRDENAKSYESQRLASQFLGISLDAARINTRTNQSAKIAYVALSRATDFVCVAIHASRFDRYLATINRNDWEVVSC